MSKPNPKNKAEWRAHFADSIVQPTPEALQDVSALLASLLLQSNLYKDSKTIALFSSVGSEPRLQPVLNDARATKKQLLLPRFDESTKAYHFVSWAPDAPLEKGPYNIPQPIGVNSNIAIDVILVPGVAFDRSGNRLGHGAGIYDRLLANTTAVLVGVAYEYQIVPRLPYEPHDRPMHYILSEKGLFKV